MGIRVSAAADNSYRANMNVLGLDIGGANLKAACSNGLARSQSFALWKQPNKLPAALRQLVTGWHWDRVAVTMTGELCDCFATKRAGVLAILQAAEEVFVDAVVWQTNAKFAPLIDARADPLPCAAANWLALATYCGRLCPSGRGLLVDIGSTTTDVVPLVDGQPTPSGRTDTERLRCGELVYTGMRRTPVCAILGLDGMAEFFATTQDVGLILGDISDDPNDHDTADQRPATRPHALARIARMMGGDRETMGDQEIEQLALRIRQRQREAIQAAVQRVAPALVECSAIVSGSGEALGRHVVRGARRVMSLRDLLGVEISQAAAAYAVAMLASEALYHHDHQ